LAGSIFEIGCRVICYGHFENAINELHAAHFYGILRESDAAILETRSSNVSAIKEYIAVGSLYAMHSVAA